MKAKGGKKENGGVDTAIKYIALCLVVAALVFIIVFGLCVFFEEKSSYLEKTLTINEKPRIRTIWWGPDGLIDMKDPQTLEERIAAIEQRQQQFASSFLSKYNENYEYLVKNINNNLDRIHRVFKKTGMGIKPEAGKFYKHRYSLDLLCFFADKNGKVWFVVPNAHSDKNNPLPAMPVMFDYDETVEMDWTVENGHYEYKIKDNQK